MQAPSVCLLHLLTLGMGLKCSKSGPSKMNTQVAPQVSLGPLHGTEASLDCCCGQRLDQDEVLPRILL